MRLYRHRPVIILVTSCLLLVFAVLGVASAQASSVGETGPQWTVSAVSSPTNLSPVAKPAEDSYQVTVTNTGGAPSEGPIEITDEPPRGLASDSVGASGENPLDESAPRAGFSCVLRVCDYTGVVVPGQTLVLSFPIDVSAGPFSDSCEVPGGAVGCLTNIVSVSGGGALAASMSTPTVISSTPASFGFAAGGSTTALSSEQAGSHPDITTSIAFNTVDTSGTLAGYTKDLTDLLPPGFAGDLVDTPSCTGAHFIREECAIGTQIGVTTVTLKGSGGSIGRLVKPVYNLTPNSGELAKIGFLTGSGSSVEAGVSLSGDYGLSTFFANFNQSFAPIVNASLTIWGVPADPIHNPLRENGIKAGEGAAFGAPPEGALAPFFTNPTSCGTEPLNANVEIDSWENPSSKNPSSKVSEQIPFGPVVGCDHLTIEPSLTAEVSTNKASSPTGFDLGTNIPQTYSNAEGLATSTLKEEVVTLPEGMTVNPSAGAGLAGCTPAQYAEESTQFIAGKGCPSESKLGTIKVISPSVKEEATGSVFLAQPYDNLAEFGEPLHPNGSLLALYVIARIPARGVLLKFAGKVEPNLQTGQLVTTFDNLPPLPFSLATFSFSQGPSSPLVSPPSCGHYTVQAQLTPYSDPQGTAISPPIPPFAITQGVNGGPCPTGGVPPFKPQVISGTENNDAGSYSPLYLRIVREDGEQEITKFTTVLPPGLTGNLSGIPFCSEAQIEAARRASGTEELEHPSCPAASEIGHTIVGAGVGSVLAQTPGKVYLAGSYHGSALSIVSVTAVKVGPFDLGTVVIRFALRINPITAQVEVDGTGSDPIPHIIDGIVVHVRDIRVYIDKQNFTLNPTNCGPMAITATITGAGANPADPADQDPVTITRPFQAVECSSLSFKPTLKVSTSGKTSRANGASLTAKLTYPKAPQGSQANIRSVKVDLPRQLPSRLTTLQKACVAAQFEANPAGCPTDSIVGHATANTPILPVPLTGPAYFVSHGGAKFPELIIVLQGYGITIDLHAETFISKAGITSSTFHTVPDQPVTSFQLTLPQGRYSALAANGNLCKSKLSMPTAFTAQNGTEIHESTKIGVTDCPKTKTTGNKHKKNKAKKK
jgi:hypothetical protein